MTDSPSAIEKTLHALLTHRIEYALCGGGSVRSWGSLSHLLWQILFIFISIGYFILCAAAIHTLVFGVVRPARSSPLASPYHTLNMAGCMVY